ncbi:hypothetical protein HNQ50_003997 [Silvimonas terrae]|uniref:Uncharacterized protein n=1 Tax=Silvimonas terrae TaxID=300266 RepID=A0A840RM48_9NEIS|nr:hypothetical protein [Silvimonas terrae]MBB5193243.1 hypothetical protein [Silvimonas terrae]
MTTLERNAALEFHDSEVRDVEASTNTVTVNFAAAYVHRSEGRPAIDAGSGYMQSVQLVFADAQYSGPINECIGLLSDGLLKINGETSTTMPIPLSVSGSIYLEMGFANGSHILIAAQSLICRASGEAKFIESFDC